MHVQSPTELSRRLDTCICTVQDGKLYKITVILENLCRV